jgi:hypothetical protein
VLSQRTRHHKNPLVDGEPKPLHEEDIKEILEEKVELIRILEHQMEDLASTPFESLMEKWMLVVKENYENYAERIRMQKEERVNVQQSNTVSGYLMGPFTERQFRKLNYQAGTTSNRLQE